MSISVASKPISAPAFSSDPVVHEEKPAEHRIDHYTREDAIGGLGHTLLGGALVGGSLPLLAGGVHALAAGAGIAACLPVALGTIFAVVGVGAAIAGISSYTDIAQTKTGKWLAGALAIVPGALAALTFANGVALEAIGVHADPGTLTLLANSAVGAGVLAFATSAVAWARAAFTKVKGE